MADFPTVPLQSTGEPVEVEVIIGEAQIGAFKVALYSPDGRDPVLLGEGVNSDQIVDVFEVCLKPNAQKAADRECAAADIDRHILFWKIAVSSPSGAANERFSTIVLVRQAGLLRRAFTKEGALGDQTIQVQGGARLVVGEE